MPEMHINLNDNNRLSDAKFGAAGDFLAMRVARQQDETNG
jgi:hypothetical protein